MKLCIPIRKRSPLPIAYPLKKAPLLPQLPCWITSTNRATHAKGIVLLGKFTPNAGAKNLSKAPHFQKAHRIEQVSREEHELVKELHPAVQNIEKVVGEVAESAGRIEEAGGQAGSA